MQTLNSIAPRDREILMRFYLREEPADRICSEMGLSETQFHLLKSRAKARFAQRGNRIRSIP
jgi:RNA polymerase sigma-70 factor (ECF subfamily)